MGTKIDIYEALERVERLTGRIFADRPHAGFSLVELLAVMVLMGALMAIAVPRINLGRSQVDSGILQAQLAVAVSRGKAILRQHDLVITFDQVGKRFYVLYDANNNGTTDTGEQRVTVQLSDGVTFGRGGAAALNGVSEAISFTKRSEDLPALKFHRNGAASEEGILYLTSLRAAGGEGYPQEARALVIERSTGRVHCYSYRTLAWKEGC